MVCIRRVVLTLGVLGLAAVSHGAIITVDDDGPAEFSTIQAAVEQAGDGDIVEIKPGVYTGPGNWDVEATGKFITIRSVDPNDPQVVDATIVNCHDPNGAGHRGFRLVGLGPEIALAGLTITGGGAVNGGGVECLGFVTLSRCHILNCRANRGGGVFCSGLWEDESLGYSSGGDGATVRILDCRIEHNVAGTGGGVYASSDGVLVRGCTIERNQALSNGGGIAGDFTVADLENDSILGNRAGKEGGGLWLHETAATVADCWLAGNWAGQYGGALCVRNTSYLGVPEVIVRGSTLAGNETDGEAGGLFLQDLESGASPSTYGLVNSSILWHNQDRTGSGLAAQIRGPTTAAYSCIRGIDPNKPADSHNLAADPLLVRWPDNGGDGWGDNPDTGGIDESCNDNFGDPHLQPASPCIQAGDPVARIPSCTVDLDGQPRKMNGIIEIGVDEYDAWGIIILRPRGGEILTGGTTQDIVWEGPVSEHRLRLEFSADGGEHWEVLDANVPSSGRLAWLIPETVQSDACLIRATPIPAQSPLQVAYSDLFSIYPAGFQADIESKWRTGSADFQRTGRSRDAGPTIGCLRWQFDAGTAITCAPVISLNGRIHLATYDGQVCTLDAEGRLLWACDTHDAIWSSPTVADDGTLYVSGNSGRVHEIAPDGRLRRSYSVIPTNSSPAILPGGKLAVGSGILNLSTGVFVDFWTADQEMNFASPAVGPDGTVYAAAWDTPGLYAFDPNSQAVKWTLTSKSQGRPFAGPVVGDNGLVYQTFASDSCLYAVDATTGALAWTVDLTDPGVVTSDRNLLGDDGWTEPVVGPDGTVYASLDDPFVRAIDPATGRIKWVTRLGTAQTLSLTMAVDRQGYLYAAGDDGCLYVLDTEGRQVSRFESDTPLDCPVIAAEGLLLVIGLEGESLDDAADVLYAIGADPACVAPDLRPPEDSPTPPRRR